MGFKFGCLNMQLRGLVASLARRGYGGCRTQPNQRVDAGVTYRPLQHPPLAYCRFFSSSPQGKKKGGEPQSEKVPLATRLKETMQLYGVTATVFHSSMYGEGCHVYFLSPVLYLSLSLPSPPPPLHSFPLIHLPDVCSLSLL